MCTSVLCAAASVQVYFSYAVLHSIYNIMRVLTFSRLSALRIEIALDPLDTPYSTCRNSRIHQEREKFITERATLPINT